MSASVSCVVFAIRRRSFPTRRVSSTKTGISAKANNASFQFSTSMPTIVATTVVTLEAIDVAVFVTTFCTPPMSFEILDCTSPVRVRVKKASDRRCRCRKTAARRSCITRWPTWLESSVWTTPSTPVTIAIAIIPPALNESAVVSFRAIASRTRLSRNAGTTPSPAETTISTRTPAEPQLVRREERADAAQVRAAHLRIGGPLGRRIRGVEEHAHRIRVRRGMWLTSASGGRSA